MIGTDIKFYGSGASNLEVLSDLCSRLTACTICLTQWARQKQSQGQLSTVVSTSKHTRHGHSPRCKIWIDVNTTSADSTWRSRLGDSALSGTESSIADETTDPGLTDTFSAAATEGAAKVISDMAAGEHKAIWIKRIILHNPARNPALQQRSK